MSEKKVLIEQDTLDDMIRRSSDEDYLRGLTEVELRKFYQDSIGLQNFFMMMQNVAKELCNSVYGGFGTPSLRYFNQELAADITGEGRHHCLTMERTAQTYFKDVWPTDTAWIEKLRAEFPDIMGDRMPKSIAKDIVITCDTDSNYIMMDYVFESLGLDAKKIDVRRAVEFIVYFMKNRMDPLYDKILKSSIAKRNGNSTMIFELEAVGGFGIFAAKKKYVSHHIF